MENKDLKLKNETIVSNDLKIGTKIRIRKELKAGEFYAGVYFNSVMETYIGEETSISNIIGEFDAEIFYTIDCDKYGYYFNAIMLEKI